MMSQHNLLKPPYAIKKPVNHSIHGFTRQDDYAWMRAQNWQEVLRDPALLDDEIRQHLEAENDYQAAFMADTQELQQQLVDEMKGRIKQDDSSVPVEDGDFAYGTCYETGQEQPLFFRTSRAGHNRQIYLDGNREAEGKAYFRLGGAYYAPDHQKFVWSYDDKGSEFFTLKIRDFGSLHDAEESVSQTTGHVVWDGASAGFFYSRLDDNHRPCDIYYHRLGTMQDEDVHIYHEADAGFFVGLSGSVLNNAIFIEPHDHETSEVWMIDAAQPLQSPRLIKARQKGVEYSLTAAHDCVYVLTNQDGAHDFKIMQAPIATPEIQYWQEIVPHEEGRLILTLEVFQQHLVWLERKDSLPRIIVFERGSGQYHAIAFEEEAYALALHDAAEYDSPTLRFSYASMTTPSQLFSYDRTSRERHLLKSQEVPSGHNPADYVTRRLMVTAEDGAQIPVSLLYHKNTPLDGCAPCLLYGYGAYGITIPADFNSNILSLVNRGFIYAIAHIRGGKDKGFHWYIQGKHRLKCNSFSDFIAVGRHLVAKGFTRHDRLIAEGGSAGGMLMGAVANMAPQDYRAIVAVVPFVDVLTTMLDDSLPLTPPEWPEWGNPLQSRDDYALIAAYSPYDNITAQHYPPILAMAGLSDPRVTYWEPAKWVARLRDIKLDDNPVLLRTNMEAGHAGASGRFARLKETAFIFAFILKIAGNITSERR